MPAQNRVDCVAVVEDKLVYQLCVDEGNGMPWKKTTEG